MEQLWTWTGGDVTEFSASPGHCRFWHRVMMRVSLLASRDWFLLWLSLNEHARRFSCDLQPAASNFNQSRAPTCSLAPLIAANADADALHVQRAT